MSSLDEEIAALKAEIEGYKLKLNDPTITESRYDKLIDLIKSCRDNLTRLLDEKKALSAGAVSPVYFLLFKFTFIFRHTIQGNTTAGN